jgi:hypothetical protein
VEVTGRNRRELLIWSAVFAIAGIFQFYRGTPTDGVIFFIAIALIATTNTAKFIPFKDTKNRNVKGIYLIIMGVLTAFKVHTDPALLAILLLIPILLLRKNDAQFNGIATLPMLRSVGIWAALGVAVSFYEMLNFVIGNVTHHSYHYPTISMLVDPMLHSWIGRPLFVLCWGWVGYKIIFQKAVE